MRVSLTSIYFHVQTSKAAPNKYGTGSSTDRVAVLEVRMESGSRLGRRLSCLLLVEFPARIQVVEIQNRVEDEKVAALRLATPHRVC